MKKDHGMESSTVDKYLSVMVQDSVGYIALLVV